MSHTEEAVVTKRNKHLLVLWNYILEFWNSFCANNYLIFCYCQFIPIFTLVPLSNCDAIIDARLFPVATFHYRFLPPRASEQGNVIGLVSVYIIYIVVIKKKL